MDEEDLSCIRIIEVWASGPSGRLTLSVIIKARLETVPSSKALLASADWHPCQQMRDLGHDSCMQGSKNQRWEDSLY